MHTCAGACLYSVRCDFIFYVRWQQIHPPSQSHSPSNPRDSFFLHMFLAAMFSFWRHIFWIFYSVLRNTRREGQYHIVLYTTELTFYHSAKFGKGSCCRNLENTWLFLIFFCSVKILSFFSPAFTCCVTFRRLLSALLAMYYRASEYIDPRPRCSLKLNHDYD